jgi:hypothetical protein
MIMGQRCHLTRAEHTFKSSRLREKIEFMYAAVGYYKYFLALALTRASKTVLRIGVCAV